MIPVGKLDFAEAQDDYVALSTEGKKHLKQQTISSLETALDPQRFLRIHRSYIVNLERVTKIEPYSKDNYVVVLGGGHVGLALARLGVDLGYGVLVGDDRDRYARPDRFPAGVEAVHTNRDYELSPGALPPGRDRYVAVVTRCWETDLAALRPWLSDRAPAVKYLGLIGSARKVRGVLARLAEEGVLAEKLDAIRAPIGLSIGAVTPEEIAVSILAEVTAVRRGEENPGYPRPRRTGSRVSTGQSS